MSSKQKLVIIAPVLLIAVMYPVFQVLAGVFRENWRIGWFLGLVVYWLICGGAFPMLIIGKDRIVAMIRPQRPNRRVLVLVAFPVLIASIYRLIPGMEYEKPSVWILLMLLSTTVGNGLFEEVLWRGVYLQLFPDSALLRMIWPSIWFALWHYAPGSVSPSGNVFGLMIGSGIFGLYLSYLANRTNTLWWCIVAHMLGGIVMLG